MSFDALVLCGGGSRRMGTDKALLELGDKTFLERALDAAADADRIVLVGPQREIENDRCIWTREDPPGGGPVAAIAAGVGLVASENVVILAVDHPFVEPPVIHRLLAAAGGHDGAIVVDPEGMAQPLVGIYRTARLSERLDALDAVEGAAIKTLVSGLDLARVEDDRAALDCDSPEDLTVLEGWSS